MQELVRTGELTVGKIDGKKNPAKVLTKHIGSKELQEQLINLGMVSLDQHADLLAELDAAQALHVASVLAADATSSSRISHANKSMHPWKPKHATTISALQLVAAASLLQGSKGEKEIVVYRGRIIEYEVQEITYSDNYDQGFGLAMMMLGILLIIIAAICALWVQTRKKWRQVISQGESSHGVSEGAPLAAPSTPEADKGASAPEGAPLAAPQARAEADPEPSPHKTQRCSVLPSLRQRRASQGSASSGSRDQYGRGAEEQEQGTARAELQQPKAPETTAARTAQNTECHKRNVGPSPNKLARARTHP